MYESTVVGTGSEQRARHFSLEEYGFDDKQCSEEVMETEIAYHEYQRRSKKKSRRPRPEQGSLVTSLKKDELLPVSN